MLSVIYRLESTQAAVPKDTILNLPKTDSVAAPVPVPGDGLPAIPTPGVDTITTAPSQLPDIIAEAVVPLACIIYISCNCVESHI